jgi:hypothetical protein
MGTTNSDREKWIEETSSKVATDASNLLAGLLLIKKVGLEKANERLKEIRAQGKQPHELLGTDEIKDDGYDF